MKNLLFIAALILGMSSNTSAQDFKNLTKASHITNDKINLFEGKWQSKNKNFNLDLILKKVAMPLGDMNIDGVIGFHKLYFKKEILSQSMASSEEDQIKNSTLSARVSSDVKNQFQGYFVLDKNSTKYRINGKLTNEGKELIISFTPTKTEGITLNNEEIIDVVDLPKEIRFIKK